MKNKFLILTSIICIICFGFLWFAHKAENLISGDASKKAIGNPLIAKQIEELSLVHQSPMKAADEIQIERFPDLPELESLERDFYAFNETELLKVLADSQLRLNNAKENQEKAFEMRVQAVATKLLLEKKLEDFERADL